jgi:predicted nucleic acid-binding protein
MIIFDSSAWIEYFKDTKNADIVEKILNEEKIITPSIVLLELSCKADKENWNFLNQLKFIRLKSTIAGMNEKTIINCGRVYNIQRKNKPKFGIADAVILTIAKEMNARILTKDDDFRNIESAIMLN